LIGSEEHFTGFSLLSFLIMLHSQQEARLKKISDLCWISFSLLSFIVSEDIHLMITTSLKGGGGVWMGKTEAETPTEKATWSLIPNEIEQGLNWSWTSCRANKVPLLFFESINIFR